MKVRFYSEGVTSGAGHAAITRADLSASRVLDEGSPPIPPRPDLRTEAHRFLGGTCKQLSSPVLRVGGVEDHAHILCRLGRTITVADLIKELKRESSKWLKTKNLALSDFHWQNGYGAFSIGPGHIDALIAYIDNQEEHHRKESFQEEFRRLLKKYGLA